MDGELQPPDRGDKLDGALLGLKIVWGGLFTGGLIIAVVMVALVISGNAPNANLGELSYLFLLAVPVGLLGAFVLAPMMTPKNPEAMARPTPGKPEEGTKPDDPYYWFPAYSAGFVIRASILEGTTIICTIGFLVTANWSVLGGAVVMLAAQIAQMPTRAAVESFAAAAQVRRTGEE